MKKNRKYQQRNQKCKQGNKRYKEEPYVNFKNKKYSGKNQSQKITQI